MFLRFFPLIDKIPIRFRLSLSFAIWMSIIYIFIGLSIYKVVENHLLDSVNAALISSANSVYDSKYNFFKYDQHRKNRRNLLKDDVSLNQFLGERYIKPHAQIISISGKIHSRSDNMIATLPMTAKAITRAEEGLTTFETFYFKDRPPLRQYTLPIMVDNRFTGEVIQVGVYLQHTYDSLKSIAFVLWLVVPMTLLIAIILGYILTARALKTVTMITSAANELGIDDLSIRLPLPKANDEFLDLSNTFNRMLDRLEDAVKRLRRFTGDVSHELRTPLAVLRGEAELALRKQRSNEFYQDSLQRIYRESMSMSDIVNDLLLLARAESRSVAMNWQVIGILDFIDSLYLDVSPLYQKHEVKLKVDLDTEIEEISCAKGYLSIALKNILINAAKHSNPCQEVSFKIFKENEYIVFQISDHGSGIPKDCLTNIFDPFFRVDEARNRDKGGVGIGLSLALALIKLHKGIIDVESEEGVGTTFSAKISMLPQQKTS